MKAPRRYQAVLFDFDGTLLPSLPLWVRAYRIAMHHFGLDLDDHEVIRHCLFKDWHIVATDLALPSGEAVRLQVDVGLREAFLDAVLFPFVLPLIDHCRVHGLQTALVTSSPRSLLSEVMPKLGLHDQFDFVICGDDVKNYKPHPEPVLTTLQALRRQPHEAIMVGDAHVDMLAGKAAGTATALFLPPEPSPFHSPERLRATSPDHVFEHHRELPGLLGLPEMAVVGG